MIGPHEYRLIAASLVLATALLGQERSDNRYHVCLTLKMVVLEEGAGEAVTLARSVREHHLHISGESSEVSMFKGRHFDRSVILLCVRWYLAYGLSLRDLEEMMEERNIHVDHSTVHRWVLRFSPQLLERFNKRKRAVTGKWHVDETYVKVRGEWMYFYRGIDSVGDTVEFFFSEHRDLAAAKRFFNKALNRHGRPDRVIIDGSQTNREAILSCDTTRRLKDRYGKNGQKPISIRASKYLNNRIEQDHRRIKGRIRPMLGFKTQKTADIILSGVELVHMMRKRQARFAYNPAPSLAEQFNTLAA